MKYFFLAFSLLFYCCKQPGDHKNEGKDLLLKCIKTHDPDGIWAKTDLNLYIQEPRIQNPTRYSKIRLNKATNEFFLERNRDQHISTHVINENGLSKVFLNGVEKIDTALVKKYRLQPERNLIYKNFYAMLYGLPMTLNNDAIFSYGEVNDVVFNHQNAKKVAIELKEKMFSKHWNVFLNSTSHQIIGIEMIFPEDSAKGERLYFENTINLGTIKIPRIRHWHHLESNEYAGSDIIINKI